MAFYLLQALQGRARLEGQVVDVGGGERGAFLERIVGNGSQELFHLLLNRHEDPHGVLGIPPQVHLRLMGGFLIGIRLEIDHQRPGRGLAYRGVDASGLDGKVRLPIVPSDGVEVARGGKIEDSK